MSAKELAIKKFEYLNRNFDTLTEEQEENIMKFVKKHLTDEEMKDLLDKIAAPVVGVQKSVKQMILENKAKQLESEAMSLDAVMKARREARRCEMKHMLEREIEAEKVLKTGKKMMFSPRRPKDF